MSAIKKPSVIKKPSGAQKNRATREELIKEVASRPGQLKISNLFRKSVESICQVKSSTSTNEHSAIPPSVDNHGCTEPMQGVILLVSSNMQKPNLFFLLQVDQETIENPNVNSTTEFTTNPEDVDNDFSVIESIEEQRPNFMNELVDHRGTPFVLRTFCTHVTSRKFMIFSSMLDRK